MESAPITQGESATVAGNRLAIELGTMYMDLEGYCEDS